jgi:hypothetical protein
MKISEILKEKQPNDYEKLKDKIETLSFSDFKRMMNHNSYKRTKGGALKQTRYSSNE